MSFDLETLYELLPAIHRIRDAEQGEPLKQLLTVLAREIAVLEEDLAQSYDDHFIETCSDWVIPYLGDLIGCRGLYGNIPSIASARAEVANTIGYRRRKGTAVALEQLARDVTGWHAHVVEFFERLATTQYLNHLRPDNRSVYLGGLTRDLSTGALSASRRPLWEPLERLDSPFDSLAHTIDVRRIEPGRGRYNLPNIGIFLWRLNSYPLTGAQPFKVDDRRYLFSPLGNNAPLFTLPVTQPKFSGLATRLNVPDPISRRSLRRYRADYYGIEKSVELVVDGQPVDIKLIRSCDLSDLPSGPWAHSLPDQIAIDPLLGRIAFPSSLPPPNKITATFHYGFSADLGGGEYDRNSSVPRDSVFRGSGVWQIGVSDTVAPVPGVIVATLAEAVQAWNALASSSKVGVITVMDSHSYASDLTGANQVVISKNTQLLIIAADWPLVTAGLGPAQRVPGQFQASGCRPHLRGNISVLGPAGGQPPGEIHLNGLLVEGTLEVSGDSLARVSLVHCTFVPGLGLTRDNRPQSPGTPSLSVTARGAAVEVDHSITGGLRVEAATTTRVAGSIVDATAPSAVAFAALDGAAAGGELHLENSTVIGKVRATLMVLATNTIFYARLAAADPWAGPVLCERRQAGCVRFSYVPPGSRTPHRYQCHPRDDEDDARVSPQFSSTQYGDPDFAQLSRRCPPEIFNGADDGSEMGAFHDLFEPQRITNLRVRLGEYLRFGLEAGIFFEPDFGNPSLTAGGVRAIPVTTPPAGPGPIA